jgi:hypothetical protein
VSSKSPSSRTGRWSSTACRNFCIHPRLPAWPAGQRGTRLVIIGFDLAEEHVRRLFAAITSQPAIDQPDRAAMEHNPLAIAGM